VTHDITPDEAAGRAALRPGPTNSLHDVAGVQVGHHGATEDGYLSGTSVVLFGADGAVAGVDVRGSGPATRETDLLDPVNAVERVHAIVLTGGSAFGLAAADGVMRRLEARSIGVEVVVPATGTDPDAPDGRPTSLAKVPIVPTAALFDLGRGGDVARRPDATFGAAAHDAALTAPETPANSADDDQPASGLVGAGIGTLAGGIKGGLGTASTVLSDGTTVAALVAVNSVGATVDPATGDLYGIRCGLDGEFAHLGNPSSEDLAAYRAAAPWDRRATLNTTLAALVTDATLTKAQCTKLAGIGHDGYARAIRPVHTMLDGDTIFAAATGERPAPDLLGMQDLLAAAGDAVSRAIAYGMLAATSTRTPAGAWRSYLDWFPSVSASTGDDEAEEAT
jgi:L-aminopeptidase/D-esterase-like protein